MISSAVMAGIGGAVSVTIGGDGGQGGAGGTVDIDYTGDIETAGLGSSGVILQSVGGGGGAGGYSIGNSVGAIGVVGVTVGLGGEGAVGGDGGMVTGVHTGNILTDGQQSNAYVAQSIGGGGGSGGFSVATSISGGLGGSANSIGIGGAGAGGGAGGDVSATVNGNIETRQSQSAGIIAQSVGGGGGSGGYNVSGGISGGLGALSVSVGLGASGGAGGVGGAVEAVANGQIITRGNQSTAVLAQSVGGGGGSGGFVVSGSIAGGVGAGSVAVGIGGTGGNGGDGGTVDIDATGKIFTYGANSSGLVAQSIGGGGGDGGFSVAAGIAGGVGAGTVSFSMGGTGGQGGDGNTVTLTNAEQIYTEGTFSAGIVAQSVGGGGGNGGFSVSAGGVGGVGAGAVSVGMGGTGGMGGNAGHVDTTSDGNIITKGDFSNAYVAQSIGGGGGNGGFNVAGGIAGGVGAGAINVGLGGTGGAGGQGSTVDATSNGLIYTSGDFSFGMIAQSIGGGGGAGGFNVAGGISGGVGAGSISVGLGGNGGSAGDGAKVIAKAAGIQTDGDYSTAFVAQSIGGAGGAGGFSVAGAISGGVGAGAISVGLGGNGAGGGDGGEIDADITGDILTQGNYSEAVVAQSIGGGGGNGGFNVAFDGAGGGVGAGGLAIGLGGSGGSGGDADYVDLDITGNVETRGDYSNAVVAQSLGGGGGAGGFNVSGSLVGAGTGSGALSFGMGGSGGGGGDAGNVDVDITGLVKAGGDESRGVIAQSLGGGGGAGGFNVSGSMTIAGTGSGSLNIGLGGAGGDGGDAGDVNVILNGAQPTEGLYAVITEGVGAVGVTAQSIGGGGGAGGFNATGGMSVSGSGAGNAAIGIGGSGGGGGDAGDVLADITGNIQTNGLGSTGVLAQSVGGGGGSGGLNVTGAVSAANSGSGGVSVGLGGAGGDGGDAGDVTVNVEGNISTFEGQSHAVLAQSVGGGGGAGGINITGSLSASGNASGGAAIGIGGFGGGGGDAGDVGGKIRGDIRTAEDDSAGLIYQSIGGGGGAGGMNVSGVVSLASNSSGALGFGLGGFGGDGGDAGDIDVDFAGSIYTRGDGAYGSLLQSVGGGGGAGGMNVTAVVAGSSQTAGSVAIGLGGFGGAGGQAGDVIGKLDGDVQTDGDNAWGALLQSLGGSGGAGGMNVSGSVALTSGNTGGSLAVGIGGFGGGGGDAGDVRGTVNGDYLTKGGNSAGIIAQSIGGGGGNGGLNVAGALTVSQGTSASASLGLGGFGGDGGLAGEVVFNREGDTMTEGAYSNGILLQSVGGSGGAGAINVVGALSFTNSATSTAVTLGVGGFGGGGGDAGSVTATIDGSVWAKGVSRDYTTGFTTDEGLPYYVRHREGGSNGVVAQSIGGGGGAGGINVSAGISLAPPQSADTRAATFGIGGFGGSGGHANTVDLTVGLFGKDRVQVQANGDNSSAIIAQSIGGGGGTGGLNVSGSVTLDGQLTIGIGGFGGSGGDGDDVTLKSNADVFAAGNYSRGLLVQSIGGGGGAGAINVAGGFSIDTYTKEPTVVFGLGGFGGGGGASGDVTVNHAGNILIEGLNSVGAMIQSIAGGGGSGGLNVSAAANVGEKDAFAISAGIGGSGGAGDDAGDVDYTSLGNIFVGGEFKTIDGELNFVSLADDAIGGGAGIIAQSIGGGGGTGGINAAGVFSLKGSIIAMGVGGSGGTGGHGGEVSITRGYDSSTGTEVAAGGVINTFGNGTTGLIAQSIGGGGGNAGYNFVLGVKPTGSGKEGSEIGAQLVVGGSGAGAGSGDAVDVRHNGTILTHGNSADGLLAQSIGGGGGNASYNIGLGVYRGAAAGVNLTLGGGTGAAGRGDTVDVDHKGDIVTLGHNSRGIVAQSIGGGGGNVGTDVVIGALANSSLSVSIGRKGGSGGEGGAVNVKADGRIYTSGIQADGIVAQSIGGGGGISSAISVSAGTKNEQEESVGGSLSVGIEGGVGATADVVRVAFDGELVTAGDDSRGILAQSIGGGGGVGGAASNTLFFAGTSGNIAVGAAGGQGASSSNVYVDNLGLIQTSGQGSDGILAQSIGGGGGLGGAVRTLGIQVLGSKGGAQNTATMGIGGSGGEGATAAAVLATNAGRILTSGDNAFGIRAQSIGGGGGIGGAAYAVTIQGPADNNALEINVGGSGGTGGAADLVSVTNTGLIYTKGDNASGISANSIGGGGGDAGTVLSLLINATGGSTSNRLVTNVGGMGGEGGTGGNVRVKNLAVDGEEYSGVILTEGDNSHGILAQSLGGGGGNGSSVVNLQVGVVGGNSVVGGLSVGGMGGTGNVAGTVDVENTGTIYTQGAGSHGILAQSIGGGGGNGGLAVTGNLRFDTSTAAPAASLGGFGGDGGNGAKVHVINSGSILTTGANAHGIVAQSIGGGGGNANVGLAAGNGYASAITSTALSFALGNIGGGVGGIGGEVIVDHTGDITVTGEGSVGIKAESINGGGGTLVLDITNLVGLTGMPYVDKVGITHPGEPMIIARLGAESATTMNTGKVTVNTTGTINAGGERSVLDLAQSIAGGGGTLDLKTVVASHAGMIDAQDTGFNLMLGGVSGLNNAAADIEAEHTGAMLSLGDLSTGILAQAIGGGGGRAVVDFTAASGANIAASQIVLGAIDTTGEAGGAVDRQQDGAVVTDGDFSTASLLQSIGGGGGSFVANLTGSNDGVSALLGANGGSGAHGRNIMASYSGGTQTFGDYASGLVLQSIGAGGGELRLGGQSSADITLGGAGGVSGDAGNISLDHNGAIFTSGINAHGMVLQSIGGGGGAAFGDLADANVDLSSDNSGNAGSVFMRQADAIYVTGNGAYGAIVQSLGGGGGWVDGAFAGSANGAGAGAGINLGFAQGVFALGANGVGIFAQSQGVDGAGDIAIQADGAVRGGSANGAGIVIDGGATNLITSNVSLSAISGWAMRASGGNDDVVNNGMVAGNIDLGGGDNRFLNSEGASFLAFNTINLREPVGPQTLRGIAPAAVAITPTGDAGTFTNAGLFRVGLEGTDWPIDLDAGEEFGNLDAIAPVADNIYYGARVITTVDVNGDFVQTGTGRTLFDVAAGRFDSDLVNVSGDAVINGSLGINLIWLEDIRPITLFATGGSGTVGDVDLGGTLALNFSLKGDDNGVHLLIDPNFGQPFLRPNEVRLGGHMDSALEVGGATGIGRLMTALGNMVAGQEELYEAIFSELNPEGHVASMQTQYYGATSFASQMFGCDEQTADADRCIWGKASTSAFDQEATGEYWGATSRIFNARFGIQQRLNAQWAVALSGGYNSLARQQLSNGRMNTQGDGFDLGVGLLRNWTSGTDLRLTATGGWQWLESQRYGYVFKDMAGLSKGENGYLQLGGEVGHLVQAGQFYLRPALNLQATWLHNGSYEETGWDGLGARIVGDDQWIVAAEPKVTTGWSFEPARGVKAGLALTAGRVHRSEDAISLPIQLIGSSNASDPAMISTPLDRSAWRLGFEAKVVTDTGVSFQAGYDGQLGDKADVHTGSVSVRWTF
ncbi:autotransporter outer membrane beta-barrel domain-containing protein [uncultured Brevundimonas sp.]|uniref:autotransporter outer membrane beta-barrel domain-containing protein n=1 Tax=uncultured Brevundimonas sp. TaxID=213418 RepID=UPI00262BE892|nr:autotransporter outer membrane beta-barrel domain-containing protein [uncultured Brevundimonas sp.]